MAEGVRQPPPGEPPLARPRLRHPKDRRLRRRRDFVRVQERSEPSTGPSQSNPRSTSGSSLRARVTTPHFILLLAPRPTAGPCRLGIVASKKVGCAVVRNRIKRLVREAFRTRPGLFPPDVDLVAIAKQGPSDLSLAVVCREIEAIAPLLARRAREVLRAAAAPRSPAAPGEATPGAGSGK